MQTSYFKPIEHTPEEFGNYGGKKRVRVLCLHTLKKLEIRILIPTTELYLPYLSFPFSII
jgi:hypothetical protein